MTAMIKTAHGFRMIPQTKRELDQIHHTFDLQTTHSEQRTAVLVQNEALGSVPCQQARGIATGFVRMLSGETMHALTTDELLNYCEQETHRWHSWFQKNAAAFNLALTS